MPDKFRLVPSTFTYYVTRYKMDLVIQSFKDKRAEKLLYGQRVIELVNIQEQAVARLQRLNVAASLADLRTFAGNRLKALKGSRAGQFSIRINDQYRICFKWEAKGPTDVEITDYH